LRAEVSESHRQEEVSVMVTNEFSRVVQLLMDEGPGPRSPEFCEGLAAFALDLDAGPACTPAGGRMLKAELARSFRQRRAFECVPGPPPDRHGADRPGDARIDSGAQPGAEHAVTDPSGNRTDFVFVIGLPRTGSTVLHNLLSLDDTNRTVSLAEAMWPFPPPDRNGATSTNVVTDPTALTDLSLEMTDRLSPLLRISHPMRADWPEECIMLLQLTGMTERLLSLAPAPRYARWLDTSPAEIAYAELKALIACVDPTARRWVLKAPSHLRHLPLIEALFRPRAFVWLHRDPASVMASFCRLQLHTRTALFERTDPRAIGPEWLPRWADALATALADRPKLTTPIIDLAFDDICRDPLTVVDELYDRLGWIVPPSLADRATAWLHETSASARLARPRLGDFGLLPADIAEAFPEWSPTPGR
jgi:hypothetical protein